jgi:flagellar protein FlgJ
VTIGTQYFEQYRYDTKNLPLARSADDYAGGPSFAEYLEKAADGPISGNPAPLPEAVNRSEALEGPLFAGRAPEESLRRSPGKPVIDKTSELYEQCQELQTFLVKNLLTGMRNTVQKSGLIEDRLAGKFYEDMLWDEYAKDFSRNAGFGLAELAYLELTGQRGIRR